MEKLPLDAWLDLLMSPVKMQTEIIGSMMQGTLAASTNLSFGAPRRRSTAQLTLVSSNNWVRSKRSKAKLSVVPN